MDALKLSLTNIQNIAANINTINELKSKFPSDTRISDYVSIAPGPGTYQPEVSKSIGQRVLSARQILFKEPVKPKLHASPGPTSYNVKTASTRPQSAQVGIGIQYKNFALRAELSIAPNQYNVNSQTFSKVGYKMREDTCTEKKQYAYPTACTYSLDRAYKTREQKIAFSVNTHDRFKKEKVEETPSLKYAVREFKPQNGGFIHRINEKDEERIAFLKERRRQSEGPGPCAYYVDKTDKELKNKGFSFGVRYVKGQTL
ncbi:Conserved_hypothetical protein [Hexamita inflata]|uniref:Uncharacterized protein n=1 Tax=Hexamita inflata TaxID=28002 RepID=A0AA86TDS9_9EUKA|nr:Conserved hypothetical protein [Hexamita inflata]